MNSQYPVVILAGGKGMRLRPHADIVPKALVPVGDMPVIWHVMKLYSRFGHRHFVITLGHKGGLIAEWFERYRARHCHYTLSMDGRPHRYHSALPDDERDWTITFVHTGEDTQTGGRVLRARSFIETDHFLATYADGLSSVDITEITQTHLAQGLPATMLSVLSPSRFGVVEAVDGRVTRFEEKPHSHVRINGGFFVFHRSIFERISGDDAVLERDVLEPLAREGLLGAHEYDGFWHCLDTQKDLHTLERLWSTGHAPWSTER